MFDFVQLDTKSTDLDLVVEASEELEFAGRSKAGLISRVVNPFA